MFYFGVKRCTHALEPKPPVNDNAHILIISVVMGF
jgi:hypothetical protein